MTPQEMRITWATCPECMKERRVSKLGQMVSHRRHSNSAKQMEPCPGTGEHVTEGTQYGPVTKPQRQH